MVKRDVAREGRRYHNGSSLAGEEIDGRGVIAIALDAPIVAITTLKFSRTKQLTITQCGFEVGIAEEQILKVIGRQIAKIKI